MHSVSVVIPTFNSASLLPRAIESVRGQRWPTLEIIVVDDGSTDDTAGVLGRLLGPDLRVISRTNAGPAAARNTGIDAARNQWVAFLDADDRWLPRKLESQFAALQRAPLARFAYADSVVQEADGRTWIDRCRIPSVSVFEELLQGNLFATPTALVHRSCFDKAGRFDPGLRMGEDWDMWLRLAAEYPCVWVREPLAVICRPAVQRYSPELLEQCTLRVLQRLCARLDAGGLNAIPRALRRRVFAWHYAVIAKSYVRSGRLMSASRLAWRALLTHALGACFLIPARFHGLQVSGFRSPRMTDSTRHAV